MDRLQLDKNAKLTGRVYFKDEVMWLGLSGSGASFTFDGTKLVLNLKGDNIAVGDNPIDYARIAVYVDGKRVVDEMINCAEKEVTVIDRTENAQSVVEIIKLSESPMSAVGIEAFAEGSAEALPEKPLKIEFIGDSITCGYGVDDEDENHQFTTATEDVTKAYAYKTAKALDAEYSMFSASGYGIVSGYTEGDEPISEQTIPQFYCSYGFSRGNFAGTAPQDIPWDFSKYVPQIIVINLGTNDDSYCRDYKDRQAVFSKLYADFLAVVREKNPQAYILCTVGIMGERIFPAVEEGIKIYLKSHADSKISSMMFHEQDGANDGFAANWHPTEKTHTKAAAVLTEKLREIIKKHITKAAVGNGCRFFVILRQFSFCSRMNRKAWLVSELFFESFPYKNTYFSTKSTASTYISGVISLRFPQTRFITTYEIIPREIPSEML